MGYPRIRTTVSVGTEVGLDWIGWGDWMDVMYDVSDEKERERIRSKCKKIETTNAESTGTS